MSLLCYGPGFVYLAVNRDWYKIGSSINPSQRVTQIGGARLLHTVRTKKMLDTEHYFHAFFHAVRLTHESGRLSERFLLSPTQIAWFCSLSEWTATTSDVWDLREKVALNDYAINWRAARREYLCEGPALPGWIEPAGHTDRILTGHRHHEQPPPGVPWNYQGHGGSKRYCTACARAYFRRPQVD